MNAEHGSPFRRASKHGGDEAGIDSWLMSYADMITLLLCFFIIFVATSEPKEDQLTAATSGLKGTFGSVELASPYTSGFRAVEGIIGQNQAYQAMSVEKTEHSLTVELAAGSYFTGNTAEFNPGRLNTLVDVAKGLQTAELAEANITIESYTSDQNPTGSAYATNWELSAARAAKMVRFLIEQGFAPERLHAAAYGGSHPKVPNADSSGQPIQENRERNNRLVIRIER